MGKDDSFKTRVAPIFDRLFANDRTGHSWLAKLIALPVGGNSVHLPPNCDLTIQEWDGEKHF
jgi:hypothetical protein